MASKSDEKCVKKTNLLVYKEKPGQKKAQKTPCGDAGKSKFKIRKDFLLHYVIVRN